MFFRLSPYAEASSYLVMNIVIAQPTYFPWPGQIELYMLADIFIIYDDVQYSKGYYTNRVQLNGPSGSKWMTIPLWNHAMHQKICEVRCQPNHYWAQKHVDLFSSYYKGCLFYDDAISLLETALKDRGNLLQAYANQSFFLLLQYLGLFRDSKILRSSELGIHGKSSDRVLAIVKHLGGTCYITGHGGAKYLDHILFEANGIDVGYVLYSKKPYAHIHGSYTPYVTSLDLIAHEGVSSVDFLVPSVVPWRQFTANHLSQ